MSGRVGRSRLPAVIRQSFQGHASYIEVKQPSISVVNIDMRYRGKWVSAVLVVTVLLLLPSCDAVVPNSDNGSESALEDEQNTATDTSSTNPWASDSTGTDSLDVAPPGGGLALGTFSLRFRSDLVDEWKRVPSADWDEWGSSGGSTYKRRTDSGSLELDPDGSFRLEIHRRSQYTTGGETTEEDLVVTGQFEQHADLLLLEGSNGGVAFGQTLSRKIRIAFSSLSDVEGLSTLQGDFYSEWNIDPVEGSWWHDVSARLIRVNGEDLPVQYYCHRDGCDYVNAGCMTPSLVGGVRFQFDIGSSPSNVQSESCTSNGFDRRARIEGPIVYIENPDSPDWPVFALRRDSIITFFKNGPTVFDGDKYEFRIQ